MRSAGQGPTATPRPPLDSPDFWRAVVDSMPDLLLLVDHDGTLLYASRSLEGTCVEDMVGRSALDYVPPEARDELRGSLREIFQGAPPQLREHRGVHADHTERWYASHTAAVRVNSEVVAAIVVARDVTAQRRLAQRTWDRQRVDALGQLAAGIVHDFNNVLAIVGAAAQGLADEASIASAAHEDVETIVTEVRRGAALTRQLLAFLHHQPPAVSEVDLNLVVRDVAAIVRRFVNGRITIIENLDPAGVFVRADRSQLEQVVMNLVLNARDAVGVGGSIALMTTTVAAGGRLLVSDTGGGMTDETRARIFEPFFTTKDQAGGTGLGLATVHAIVTGSGGQIDVFSVPGLGTTFVVTLPLERAAIG
jgi:two-component system, cell cycle sensor histidine kinase and response regulator CckA